MDEDTASIGRRLRQLRHWRGLTLKELADFAGVSPAAVSYWERGRRPLDRRSYISALAAALKVAETELTGAPHLGTDSAQSAPHAVIPALRIALQTNTLSTPANERPQSPLAELAAQVSRRMLASRRACDYTETGRVLPGMLDDLHVHVVESRDEAAKRLALETLVEACSAASAVARNLGYPDLAFLAATRAEEAAALLGDPVQRGKADFMWVRALPRAGSWERTLAAAERAANALEPHAGGPLAVQVLGMLALTASLAAASSQRGQLAEHWLGEAARLAAQVPDDPAGNWQSFSATNVNIWRITVGVERGVAGKAVLEMAAGVDEGKLRASRDRRGGFYGEVGRGLAREKATRTEAVHWLRKAEEIVPQRVRNSSPMRETVIYLRDREIAFAARELRGMAARMGIPN